MPSYEDLTFEQVVERLAQLAGRRPPGEPGGHEPTVIVPIRKNIEVLRDHGMDLLRNDPDLHVLPGEERYELARTLAEHTDRAMSRVPAEVSALRPNGE